MRRCQFEPYEGAKPYIFVGYAHKDADEVLPVLEALHRRGYRVWYDDGIAPGSEWPENIARHLSDCALMLAFISAASIASDNCRREVTFALAKRKPFLAVILRPTEMSPGMEMQLSAQQCVMKYTYTSEDAFLKKLCSCPDMDPCRALAPSAAEPAEAAAEVPAGSPASDEPPGMGEVPALAGPPALTEEPAPAAEKARRWRRRIAALAAGAAVVLALVLLPRLTRIRIDENMTVERSETEFTLYNRTVTAGMVEKINRLQKLTRLSLRQCSFESGALALLDPPETVTAVTIAECTGVDNLDFLGRLENLRSLTLSSSDAADGQIPTLSSLELQTVNLAAAANLTDLSFLQGCDGVTRLDISGSGVTTLDGVSPLLQTIDFSGTPITDLAPLGACEDLRIVYGSQSGVTDVTPLTALTGLEKIAFADCGIVSINGVFGSLRLEEVDFSGNALASLDAFQNCTVLEAADFSQNRLANIDVLEKSAATLQVLALSDNPLTIRNLDFIKDCAGLTELSMDRVGARELPDLSNAEGLRRISAVGCGLADISVLAACPALEEVYLADNVIRDISALSGLKTEYLTLDLSFNYLDDLSALPQTRYDVLGVISDIDLDVCTIPRLEGSLLVLNYDDDIAESTLPESGFNKVALIGCPADRQVAMEDLFGRYTLELIGGREDLAALMDVQGIDYSFILPR